MTSTSPDRHSVRHETTADGRKIFKVTRDEVSAARLRVAVDKSLGRETPDWVIRLANVSERG